jgi:hypothetical protein
MVDTQESMTPSEIETLGVNLDRSFRVILAPCVITKAFDRCILVRLGQVDVFDSDGSKKTVNIEGAFSQDGLLSLMTDLQSVPDPVGLPKQEEVKTHSPYMWAAVMNNGEHVQQFPTRGEEVPFAGLPLGDVAQFWIVPKDDPDSLPWYGLIRGTGFVRRENLNAPLETLALPKPGDEPFDWHYYRNNTLHFMACAGNTDQLPPHVKQVIGWRIGPLGDPDTLVFEIAIEPDGTYQVFHRAPLDHARWQQ